MEMFGNLFPGLTTTKYQKCERNLLQTLGCKQPKATDEKGAKRLVEIINYS